MLTAKDKVGALKEKSQDVTLTTTANEQLQLWKSQRNILKLLSKSKLQSILKPQLQWKKRNSALKASSWSWPIGEEDGEQQLQSTQDEQPNPLLGETDQQPESLHSPAPMDNQPAEPIDEAKRHSNVSSSAWSSGPSSPSQFKHEDTPDKEVSFPADDDNDSAEN